MDSESLLHDDFDIDTAEDHIEPDHVEPDHTGSRSTGGSGLSNPIPPNVTPHVQGERFEQRRFTGGDTLDEPVFQTILRDLRASAEMLQATVLHKQVEGRPAWDLWGPLVFSLVLSLVLSVTSLGSSSQVFSSVFAIIWLGQALVVLNIRLLGGTISYLHALSVSGYCLFPLVVVSLLGLVVKFALVRLVLAVLAIGWATHCASRVLSSSGVLPSRVVLATYPIGLYYFVLGWMCVVV